MCSFIYSYLFVQFSHFSPTVNYFCVCLLVLPVNCNMGWLTEYSKYQYSEPFVLQILNGLFHFLAVLAELNFGQVNYSNLIEFSMCSPAAWLQPLGSVLEYLYCSQNELRNIHTHTYTHTLYWIFFSCSWKSGRNGSGGNFNWILND